MQIMVGNWQIVNVCWWIRVKVTIKSHSVHSLAQPCHHGDCKQGRTTASRVCLCVPATKLMRPRMKAGGKVNTLRELAVFSIDCCHV